MVSSLSHILACDRSDSSKYLWQSTLDHGIACIKITLYECSVLSGRLSSYLPFSSCGMSSSQACFCFYVWKLQSCHLFYLWCRHNLWAPCKPKDPRLQCIIVACIHSWDFSWNFIKVAAKGNMPSQSSVKALISDVQHPDLRQSKFCSFPALRL